MIEQSKELTEFYRSYQAWLDAGAPPGRPYERDCGLCGNLHSYVWMVSELHALRAGLDQQFRDAGFLQFAWGFLPFNKSHEDYAAEGEAHKCHLNKKRVRWVKNHLS